VPAERKVSWKTHANWRNKVIQRLLESYRALGDPSRLRGDAALEYFQTLAGTLSGYPEARKGLEKLAKENPGNTR
jgi:hypothetical protein